MKFYSEPKTKAMALNLSAAICSELSAASLRLFLKSP